MTANTSAPIDRSAVNVGPIWLSPGVERRHLFTFFYAAFFSIASTAFLSFSQPYILNKHLEIPIAEQGSFSGDLAFWAEIVMIFLVWPLGVLSEKIGRRPIYCVGFLLVALGYSLYPLATDSQTLIIYRMVFALGAACLISMLATVQADYPQDATRGKLIGFTAIFNSLGIIVVVFVGSKLPQWYAEGGATGLQPGQYAFWTAAAVCVVSAIVVGLGLRPGALTSNSEKEPFIQIFERGIRAGRNPRIALSYLAGMVSRGDLTVITTFLSLWLVQVGLEKGLNIEEAQTKAGIFFATVQVTAFLWAPVAGFIIDRINRVSALCIAMCFAATGYLAMGVIDDPTGQWMIPAAVLLGMGEINAVLASQALIGQEAPANGRGPVIGLFGLFGAIGILLATKIGGHLFDTWMPAAPFVMLGIANTVLLLVALTVRLTAPGHFPRAQPQASA